MQSTEIVLTSVMRDGIESGVQAHTQTFADFLKGVQIPFSTVHPLDAKSAMVKPVFALRFAVAPFSASAGAWWYRHWHEYYLRTALRDHFQSQHRRRIVYAQDPISAAAALRTRSTEPVVMVVHFNTPGEAWTTHNGPPPREGPCLEAGSPFQDLWWQLSVRDEILHELDGMVFVSEFMRESLLKQVPELSRVPYAVIPNFVSARPQVLPSGVRDLITVGSLEPRKNQAYLLDIVAAAAGRGHSYTLTVVGDGPDRQNLERRVDRLGLRQKVQFTGHHQDPRSLMAEHRVYCHTSRMENLPMVLIEAMSSGLPVLATPVGGVPELVSPNVAGMLWPLDDPDLASCRLISLLETPGLARAIGIAGRQRFLRSYSSDVVGERLAEFLLGVEKRRTS